ncbi:transcription antitermination factor NusB [Alicyclobacillus shizuokensis]|uniref:transcription antitermination factor NusB n=1 Tax=Alicyclobacillus shizuokensis TaxID=392014 RepID=UPI0008360EA1|nr:transcription antitermination factor NusB [Alicyclobacillus shizuokensis]MCL6627516.1 transcription antitermination factor NusB [Alicyclobacillus shizuokensis]
MRRRELRRLALQALFELDMGEPEVESALAHVLEEVENASETDVAYLRRLVSGTRGRLADIDAILASHVQNWRLDRMAKVDLNILRLAVYELLEEQDVDAATIVDEAVELAKHFSTDESGRFVNGVLARCLPSLRAKA